MRIFQLLFLITLMNSGYGQSDTAQFETKGFLDFNAYYDTREQTDFNLNILAILPHNFSYFSLTNYVGNTNTSDVSGFYTEHNIIWKPLKAVPIKLDLQAVFKSGDANDALRFGPRFQVTKFKPWNSFFEKINFNYFMTAFFVEGRQGSGIHWMTQLEHVYKLKLLKNRLYIGGFADQNLQFDQTKKVSWVTEHQLGVRIYKELYVVAEYRINQYLDDDTGLGLGVEYKIVF